MNTIWSLKLGNVVVVLTFVILSILSGCSKKSNPVIPDDPSQNQPATIEVLSGNNQTARVTTELGEVPTVIVKDSKGSPVTGAVVSFSVLSGGGSLSKIVDTTDAAGLASCGTWTLGTSAGQNMISAIVSGLSNKSVQFAATARWPYWTIMVYMAADNNLSGQGLSDINDIETAGTIDEVQTVIQAEFNPMLVQELAGCDPPCMYNRSNFNTFRYFVEDGYTNIGAPDGETIDIGNRNLTDPNELREFIQWSKSTRPAEHYALILWNHGGGYGGLLQDLTSAPENLMLLSDLPTALSGEGEIDMIGFDMCMMAGFETVVTLSGLADFAVFSQDVSVGGYPYEAIIEKLNLNPTMSARQASELFADEFYYARVPEGKLTTISAYDLSISQPLKSQLDEISQLLLNDFGIMTTAIDHATKTAQSYEYPELKDLIDVFDVIASGTSDQSLLGKINALKTLVKGSSRIEIHNQSGQKEQFGQVSNVSRSNGLTVFFPSPADTLADNSNRSFESYLQQFGNSPWTQFLSQWLSPQPTTHLLDLVSNRLEAYLVWDTASVTLGTDVDLWVLEPNGEVYSPAFGSVSPNGTFTADSWYTRTWYEGYMMNRFVQEGTYTIYAWLYSDLYDHRPAYDLQYRLSLSEELYTSLFAADYPRLSLEYSWLNDPTPTEEELDAGYYTDLQPVATFIVEEQNASPRLLPMAKPSGFASNESELSLTPKQFKTISQLVASNKSRSIQTAKSATSLMQRSAVNLKPIEK